MQDFLPGHLAYRQSRQILHSCNKHLQNPPRCLHCGRSTKKYPCSPFNKNGNCGRPYYAKDIFWYCGHSEDSGAGFEVQDVSFEDWQMPWLDTRPAVFTVAAVPKNILVRLSIRTATAVVRIMLVFEVQDVSFEDWQMPWLDRPSLRESTWSTSLRDYTGCGIMVRLSRYFSEANTFPPPSLSHAFWCLWCPLK
jgi:hypothetical protein